MKKICIAILLLLSAFALNSKNLRFRDDGHFKIVQFTDIHFIYGDYRSDITYSLINEVLEKENPDLVILTGDLIYGTPADSSLMTVLNMVSAHKIPFGIVFGNHDYEQGLDYSQMLDITKKYRYNLTETAAGINGYSNYVIPVKSSDGKKDAAILYCLDSNTYSRIDGVRGYDHLHFDQITWYMDKSREYTSANGGSPVQSYAFFHIPLPEFSLAASDQTSTLIGTRMEQVCSPALNSGMFAAVKEMKDIKGIFVGHDHDNDYAVAYNGVLLAYGRYSGGNTVYNHLESGARVIELTEGGSSFTTWIRLKSGKIVNKVTYPDSF